LEPGDLLVLYSDGAVEATNAEGEEFGEERLLAAVLENRVSGPEAIRQSLILKIQEFTRSAQFEDDLTLIVFRTPAAVPVTERTHKPVASAA
jgi:serine phosphatase RsbU (regulator of sigma subunit)